MVLARKDDLSLSPTRFSLYRLLFFQLHTSAGCQLRFLSQPSPTALFQAASSQTLHHPQNCIVFKPHRKERNLGHVMESS
ncbi:hypothetical protein CEXT_323261 [Caerostris extrusa]|uniref:Uncharacterized protein n=1 Tax=Caerostris extrusa TaxID=172846 RepID=A0AAV4VD69_CAEEX|nr:hypothetical protein CEXT_323261 [Caerostris extrusa]